ncbi:SDR family NAD(P)-dependent oxidoreductase [Roseomonas nepalensis]|uniref:SDR family NAD(P)-dependent oxidoreductase n=1 Tax=Muricoccus nepalensis TaxID=1854500 RepID=A0A502G7U6_9PROT|nr:SDR family NAD(P)-dependent oxidoreductase [Roseomonas nepalensis]TPG56883.1 SDR family NAD(P)-dependent oxidoreductase [Roseomonas nepalensis]
MRTVLVTGSTRGLGLAVAERLLEEGYGVVATGRAETPELAALREASGGRLSFAPFDLSEPDGIYAFVHALTAAHGTFWGLVNNAAVGLDGVLATQHNRDIERLIRVNVVAPIVLTKYVSRGMIAAREGRIVNVSSIIATTGYSGLAAYAASKSALEGFTRSLARELGRVGVTVNAIAPGYMETDMTSGLGGEKVDAIRRRSALRRLPSPAEVSHAAAYLLGPGGAAVTGTVMTVDAGSTA